MSDFAEVIQKAEKAIRRAPTMRTPNKRMVRAEESQYVGEARFTYTYTEAAAQSIDLKKTSTVVTPDRRFLSVFPANDAPDWVAEIGAIKVELRSQATAELEDWAKWLIMANASYLQIKYGAGGEDLIPLRDCIGFPVETGVSNATVAIIGYASRKAQWMDLPGGTRFIDYSTINDFKILHEAVTPLGVTGFPVDVFIAGSWAKKDTEGAKALKDLHKAGEKTGGCSCG